MKAWMIAAVAALGAGAVHAQAPSEMPSEMPAEQPAAMPQATPPPPSAGAPAADPGVVQAPGMAIIGDQESPIGLYIMPWRASAAETGLDRPARLLDDALLTLDPDVFRRQVIYNQKLSEHLHKRQRRTP